MILYGPTQKTFVVSSPARTAPLRSAMFADRRAAGKVLSQLLSAHQVTGGIVLALPRGGVPVGDEIATALGLPLDLMLVAGPPLRRP